MKVCVFCILALFVFQGCSKNSVEESTISESPLSDEACTAIGGELKNGDCLFEGEIDMKKICDADGLEYSASLDACIMGEEATKKMCTENNLTYSAKHKGCIQ